MSLMYLGVLSARAASIIRLPLSSSIILSFLVFNNFLLIFLVVIMFVLKSDV